MKHLFICGEPRTGSTFLISLLTISAPPSHRLASLGELIHNAAMLEQDPQLKPLLGKKARNFCLATAHYEENKAFDLGIFRQTLEEYYAIHAQGRPVIVKWFSYWFQIMLQQLGHPLSENPPPPWVLYRLEGMFDSIAFVHLYREDVWKQAISQYVAEKSQQWNSLNPVRLEINEDNIPFDFPAIQALYWDRMIHQRWWERFFKESGTPAALKVSYEELSANYPGVLRRLGEALNTEIAIPPPEALELKKLSHPLKEDYYHRIQAFLQEHPEEALLPTG
jgi:LPS sulfotransferase NodH